MSGFESFLPTHPVNIALLVSTLYFFVPMFIANGSPVIAKNLPLLRHWNTPLHAEWFGKNKTYRGLIIGTLLATLVGLLQYTAFHFGILPPPLPLDAPLANVWYISALASGLMGAGALAGDAIESFVKRRIGIRPGDLFFPWDGIDYVIGACVFVLPLYIPSPIEFIFLLVIGPILSGISNVISFLIGWKKVPY